MKSEIILDLAAALVAAQAEFPAVGKDSTNPFFKSKYADLATVVKTASPVLAKHGLAISQHVGNVDGASVLTTYLLHSSGQFIAHDMPLLLPKQDPQGQGSAITYARRYSYMAVLGLVADEDDDGEKASRKPAEAYQDPRNLKADAGDAIKFQTDVVVADAPQKAELLDPSKMKTLRALMMGAQLTGAMATDYVRLIINKEAPTTNDDVDLLITALEGI